MAEYLAFRVAGDVFALPLADVREILVPPLVTLVPRAPREVLGIVSVRGQLVTVLDLAIRLSIERGEPGKRARILLVLSPDDETMGLVVDEVMSVYRLGEEEIEPAAGALGGNVAEHVTGIGRRDGQTLVLLSLSALLSPAGARAAR